jgi:hypothetical protein
VNGISLALDALVALLLLATIAFAWRLERRMAVLKREKDQFAQLLQDFARSATQADAGVKALRATATDAGRDMEALVARAEDVREDLLYLLDRAGIGSGVGGTGARPQARAAPPRRPARPPEPASRASGPGAPPAQSGAPAQAATPESAPVPPAAATAAIPADLLKALASLR